MNRLITTMLLSMVAISALSQEKSNRPTLVIGIMIDQLRSDYLESLQSHFGQNGFNRLMRNGAYFESVDFGVANLDQVSASAIIFTGAYPCINGIPSEKVYSSKIRLPENVLTDVSKIGNFTNETLSPQALAVSTIADELRIDNDGLGYVYSIAPDAQQAIILAGHAGNSAFWINDATGKWATTTFYKDVPKFMPLRNYQSPLSTRLDTMSWQPALSLSEYPEIKAWRKYYPFKYIFPQTDKDCYRAYKNSALVNEEVTSVAIDYIQSLRLGKRDNLDMLNIAYTVAPYQYGLANDNSVELQDSYIRLDRQLNKLFSVIDKSVGLNNTLIFVSSTGYFNETTKDAAKFNIPTGEFSPKRAVSLLNMYLMAVYGNGEWVQDYHNRQFFLNRKLIKDKSIDLQEIRSKASILLRQVSGISDAYTLDEVNNPTSDSARRLKHATTAIYAGDILVEINPGWEITETQSTQNKVKQVRNNMINAPAFILAPDIKPQKISSVVDATFLAPTVSRLLRIRSPNAAQAMPISL
ncbi:MAG: alkaline phosphatase family protein [Muribaculaceae bacterium]